jgi:tryptophanyl-tRNA synthetase
MEKRGRILTGHRPTGRRHLGHLVGTLENWARLQDDYDCLFLIADDPTRIHATDPGHVEDNPVFAYHDIFNEDREEAEELKARYRAGRVGDIEVKRKLVRALNRYLTPLREKRREFAARPDYVWDVLREGTARARPLAQATMAEVKEKMGLT